LTCLIPTPHLLPLSLHDALPISGTAANVESISGNDTRRAGIGWLWSVGDATGVSGDGQGVNANVGDDIAGVHPAFNPVRQPDLRSEEHTSELQSRENLVCRLLLE